MNALRTMRRYKLRRALQVASLVPAMIVLLGMQNAQYTDEGIVEYDHAQHINAAQENLNVCFSLLLLAVRQRASITPDTSGQYAHIRPTFTLPDGMTSNDYTGRTDGTSLDTTYITNLPTSEILLPDLGDRGMNRDSLMDAITAAHLAGTGKRIRLPSAGDFGGVYPLPANNVGTGHIYIEAAVVKTGGLPAGTRVLPSDASVMPKIYQSAGRNERTMYFSGATAQNYRLTGLEFAYAPGAWTLQTYAIPQNPTNLNWGFVNATWNDGSPGGAARTLVTTFIIDRCYLHGEDGKDTQRTINLTGYNVALIDSYIDKVYSAGEGQCFLAGVGAGPYKIHNNTMRAICYGEHIMFGGTGDTDTNQPSNIQVTNNHLWMPQSAHSTYTGGHKNLFETKCGNKVLVEGNVFEGWRSNGAGGQLQAVNIKTADQTDGSYPLTQSKNVTIRLNEFRDCCSVIVIQARPQYGTAATRVEFTANRQLKPTTDYSSATLRAAVEFGGGTAGVNQLVDVIVKFNTWYAMAGQHGIMFLQNPGTVENFWLTDNVIAKEGSGGSWLNKDNSSSSPATDWANVAGTVAECTRNGVTKSQTAPAGNTLVASIAAADVNASTFALNPSSPFRGIGLGGRDPGAPHALIDTAIAGVV